MGYVIPGEGQLENLYVDDFWLIDNSAGSRLWGWGLDNRGQLGDNTTINKSSPVQTISGGTNWRQVSCGQAHTAAIKTDGTLWLWGSNSVRQQGWDSYGNEYLTYDVTGQLGTNNQIIDYMSPVQTVSGGTNWKQVSCGYTHTSAIKTDGTLWSWGSSWLGDNTQTNRSSPVQTIAGGTNWKQVSANSGTGAAIKTDGTLWVWGMNTNGRLGDNTRTTRLSPVQTIAGGTNWKQVSCGYTHTSAIKTDGTLWTWGENTNGQLGSNNTTHRSSPIQTITGGANWREVSCGYSYTAATTFVN